MKIELKILIYGLLYYSFGYVLWPIGKLFSVPVNILLGFAVAAILFFVAKMITPWLIKNKVEEKKQG